MVSMNETELRALIRAAVERHLGVASSSAPTAAQPASARPIAMTHVSHGLYLTLPSGGDACLIEPAAPCTHCGFCQSHGH
jgi:hypothetical protein